MTEPAGNSFEPILRQLLAVRTRLDEKRAAMRAAHSDWARDGDARVTTFAKLANTLRATELSLSFLENELSDPSWWSRRRGSALPSGQFSFEFMAFSQFAKGSLLQFAFSAMDSGFRLYLRALDPHACKGATAQFHSVAECLLLTHLGMSKPDLVLLDLMRLLRNLIHNEGVYAHRGQPAVSIQYGGETYEFVDGQPIEFATWELVIKLVDDQIGLLERVLSHPLLANRSAPILDPACEPSPYVV